MTKTGTSRPNNSRLPPEILSEIFMLLIPPRPLPCTRLTERPWKADTKWTKVCRVCSFWQAVALGCPFLWTVIQADKPKRALRFLSHSVGQSIDVFRNDGGPMDDDLALRLRARVDDIRELELITPNEAVSWDAHDWLFLSPTAPKLESLTLVAPSSQYQRAMLSTAQVTFINHLPRLQILCIVKFPMSWDLQLAQLRRLSLYNLETAYRPTVSQLLRLLSFTPLLESIECDYAGPTNDRRENVLDHPVRLDFLKTVRFFDFYTSAEDFFAVHEMLALFQCRSPPFVAFRIPPDLTRMNNILPQRLLPTEHILTVKVTFSTLARRPELKISAQNSDYGHNPDLANYLDLGRPGYQIKMGTLEAGRMLSLWNPFLRFMVAHNGIVELSRLEALHISFYGSIQGIDWRHQPVWLDFASRMIQLRRLSIRAFQATLDSEAGWFLNLLACTDYGEQSHAHDWHGESHMSVLPRLETLEITSGLALGRDFIKAVKECLRSRVRMGHILPMLKVHCMHPGTYADMHELRAVAQEFVWDDEF